MARKQKGSKRKSAKRRSKVSNTHRSLFFAVIVFVLLGIYGVRLIRNRLSIGLPQEKLSSPDYSNIKKRLDNDLSVAFFRLGVSKGLVSSKMIHKKDKGDIEWDLSEMRVKLPKGVSDKDVESILGDAISNRNFNRKFKKSEGHAIAEIEFNSSLLYRIRFDLYKGGIGRTSDQVIGDQDTSDIKRKESRHASIGEEERLNLPAVEKEKPKVVIIVDDLGFNKHTVDRLLELGFPINFAILPYLPYSRYAAEKANQKGWDVMLHLPMEPQGTSGYVGDDAGNGVLLERLPIKEIITKLHHNISSVPYVKGVNNHMGSKFTENEELMEIVLRELNMKGLFFIDSKTSTNSKGYEIAKTLGMKTALRDVFLDQESQGENYVNSQILRLVEIAKTKGYAVGICHPYPETVRALTYMLPRINGEVEITTVSSLLN
ncbi:MAG: divergent polysaccharide deacetylase family protein [Deltaproteobacteria bacterium]|nr:divergent polysaccharide deacetylase family protein [Deltaproteobacteria bacterium]